MVELATRPALDGSAEALAVRAAGEEPSHGRRLGALQRLGLAAVTGGLLGVGVLLLDGGGDAVGPEGAVVVRVEVAWKTSHERESNVLLQQKRERCCLVEYISGGDS